MGAPDSLLIHAVLVRPFVIVVPASSTSATGSCLSARSSQRLISHTSPSHHWSVYMQGHSSKQRGTVNAEALRCRAVLLAFACVQISYSLNFACGPGAWDLANIKATVACILAVRIEDESC
jgi:hypothetical protein